MLRDLEETCIVFKTPTAYDPQSKGMAGRMSKTLMEKIRAMVKDASLP